MTREALADVYSYDDAEMVVGEAEALCRPRGHARGNIEGKTAGAMRIS